MSIEDLGLENVFDHGVWERWEFLLDGTLLLKSIETIVDAILYFLMNSRLSVLFLL